MARKSLDYRYTGFNTQPPEGGWMAFEIYIGLPALVSTHSRPKAAGTSMSLGCCVIRSFNTQPPEGGWHPKGWRINQ